jgi:hypothetical protein
MADPYFHNPPRSRWVYENISVAMAAKAITGSRQISIYANGSNALILGRPYNVNPFRVRNAIGAATISLQSGALPTGLTLSSTGLISGSTSVLGNFQAIFRVTDSKGRTALSSPISFTVGPA